MIIDSFGRKINYLRLSLTDRCNLHCRYCYERHLNTELGCISDETAEKIEDASIYLSEELMTPLLTEEDYEL